MNSLCCWLVSGNIITFLTFWYDKHIAGTRKTRIPEKSLLGLALLGGSPGAVIAMRWFRHKTAKRSFQKKLMLVIGLQVGLLILCYLVVFS